jgi:hypothetical protein
MKRRKLKKLLTETERDLLQAAVECDSLSYFDASPYRRRVLRKLQDRGLMTSFYSEGLDTAWFYATTHGKAVLQAAKASS